MAKDAKIIDQKAYLQKYLSKDKKKKKKRIAKGSGLKLIDADIDLSRLRPLDADELDFDPRDEDAPQIAGIVDERPDHLKTLETFSSSKWKVVSSNDGIDEQFNVQEVRKDSKKKIIDTQDAIFGKMYSDSEDENDKKQSNSDISPPRKRSETKDKSDSDMSPPRNRLESKVISKRKRDKSDSDISPPRSRSEITNKRNKRKDSDSDLSPPRKNDVLKKQRKKSRWGDNDSEIVTSVGSDEESRQNKTSKYDRNSTYIKERRDNKRYDSSNSPLRRKKDETDKDRNKSNYDSSSESTKRNKKHGSGSDLSPVRNRNETVGRNRKRSDSPPIIRDRRDKRDDSNHSSQKKDRWKHDKYEELSRNKYRRYDKNKRKEDKIRKEGSEDSDLSPPRKDINRKTDKTLEGKKAGLQDANALVRENAEFRRKEDEMYKIMDANVSGRHAKTVSRNLGKRESSADRERIKRENEKRKELEEKYDKWGKGLKQVQERDDKMRDMAEEGARPLARYKDDDRLDAMLRERDREGDPMLDYIREKRTESGIGEPSRPIFKGDFPPNRYNIRPGYRWDGVDRSNGYEKKYFDAKSKNIAREEEAFKWSTEDL